MLKSEGYHYDQNEERNAMGLVTNKGVDKPQMSYFFNPVELYFELNNIAVKEWTND
jgi:hypothetical protein